MNNSKQNDKTAAVHPLAQSSTAVDDAFFQTFPAMMHSIDASGTVVAVSQRWLEILGYSRNEVIGRKSTEFLTEESQAYARENVLPEFFRTGRCIDIPYQMVAKDGRILDVLLSASCERDAAGLVKRSLAIMQDITARKHAERKLDAAKAYAENLLRTASVMVVELDDHGQVRRLNRAAERLSEYATEAIKGQPWFGTVAPQSRYATATRETGSGTEFDCPMVTQSGMEKHVHWHSNEISVNGNVSGTLLVGVDITEQKEMARRLAESERLLKEAQRVAQVGSWFFDFDKQRLWWSEEIFRILGLDPALASPSKATFLAVLHPEDLPELKRAFKRAIRTHTPYEIRFRLRFDDGMIKYVHQRCEFSRTAKGQVSGMVGTLQDVTMSALQEMAFQESEDRFRTIADFTFDWEYWRGENKELLYISPSCQRISGYTQAEFIRDPDLLERIVHPEDRERFACHLHDFASPDEAQLDFRIIAKDGQVRWIAHGCRPVMKGGKPNGRRVSNRDITDLKIAEQLAQQLAYFDALTGLPNRRMLHDRLEQAVALAAREKRQLALLFIDLDKFKQINDTLGHDVGDQLLIEVARRFALCTRVSDTVSRTGGDEFIVLLPTVKQREDATTVAQKLLGSLQSPIQCGPHSINAAASIGIALFAPDRRDDATELMKRADMAMYQAKQAGGSKFCVLDETAREDTPDSASS